ncbi:Chitinase 2, partial [Coemansia sp. RSA 486]
NVKIYIGAPGSQSAAGRGYVDAPTLNTIVNSVRGSYGTLGGVMTWDASQALGSGGSSSWGGSVSSNLKGGSSSNSTAVDTGTNTNTNTKTTETGTTVAESSSVPKRRRRI